MPFIDLHCDTVSRLLASRRAGEAKDLRTGQGFHLSLEKLAKTGTLLQCFALFVNLKKVRDPLEEVLTLGDLYWSELENNADLVRPVLSFADLAAARAEGKTGCLLTVEEGGVCRGQLPLLRTLHRLGVRLITLTWNYPNELAFPNGERGGLTDTGLAFLAEMERLGILADVSHLSDDGFWDLCREAKKPFLASHSGCRALWPHRRNLTDAMLKALADRGGIAGVNFYAGFLGESKTSRLADIARHLRHMITVGGLEVAALGSDFDGIDCPLELGDAQGLPLLVRALDRAGFTDAEIEALCWKNAWDFFQRTL